MKKNDVILIAGLLLAALAAFGGISWYLAADTQKAEAVVEVDGQEKGRYPLDQDTSVEIQLEDGSYNLLEIKDGRADITEASCPDNPDMEPLPGASA